MISLSQQTVTEGDRERGREGEQESERESERLLGGDERMGRAKTEGVEGERDEGSGGSRWEANGVG